MTTKAAVVGAAGRIGTIVYETVEAAGDMELTARLDAGDSISSGGLGGAGVAVESSVPPASEADTLAALEVGVNAVVGTTERTEESLGRACEAAERLGRNAVIAPSYTPSAVLVMSSAERTAPYFEPVEVLEVRRPNRVDAPSSAVISTASRIAKARAEAGIPAGLDATQADPDSARGAWVDGVNVHTVQLRGLNAHEQVMPGGPGEQLVVRRDSFSRSSLTSGVLLVVRSVWGRGSLTWGLSSIMGL